MPAELLIVRWSLFLSIDAAGEGIPNECMAGGMKRITNVLLTEFNLLRDKVLSGCSTILGCRPPKETSSLYSPLLVVLR